MAVLARGPWPARAAARLSKLEMTAADDLVGLTESKNSSSTSQKFLFDANQGVHFHQNREQTKKI